MSDKNSRHEIMPEFYLAYAFASHGKYGMFSYLYKLTQELVMKSMYRVKALYIGETPVLYKKAIAYSPVFWILQIFTLILIFCLSPFALSGAFILSTWRELRGGYTKAKEPWEKEYVAENASPPYNFDI